ncbi:tail fiber domain-containing protein [Enterobacter sp. SA187]|uniref:tail fiber domain-containing protein n=1 Tax=Enterobacter sp. SA187 TaxID=1914861 RepID=UPI0009324994|nr:tail fiber domain-containing protein [Enterobacter sp. SA187]
MNTDITSATGLTTTIMRDQWVPDKALIVTLDAGSNVSYNNKAVTAKTMHNGLTMYTSFCYSIGADGTATNSGPALISTDGNNYTKYWKFQNGSGAITSHAGTFTPGVSDIRVKNEKRVITEQEAIAFISEWESIVYSLKWTPDAMRVGFRAQDIYERFPELIERSPLMDVDGGGMIEDGMIVNVAETAAAYLVPVVQQLLRRVKELEEK